MMVFIMEKLDSFGDVKRLVPIFVILFNTLWIILYHSWCLAEQTTRDRVGTGQLQIPVTRLPVPCPSALDSSQDTQTDLKRSPRFQVLFRPSARRTDFEVGN